jgi:predicted  nucleic acid-binding Zn-ribbon protein
MIGMSSSAKSFGALAHYLANGRSGNEPERVAWLASRNLPTSEPELAGKIMRATASQNVRVAQPGYHVALSFDPGDAVDRATMERVADRTIAALGLTGHQALIVCHRDRDHPHMHLLINRVHPETGRVWNRWQDRAVIQKVLREEEIALGLRVTPGRLGPPERNQLELGLADKASLDPINNREPEGQLRPEPTSTHRKLSRTDELKAELDSYTRVVDLNREQYKIRLEVDAAHVRYTELRETAERTATADSALKSALADIYRDPAEARRRFVLLAQTQGRATAVATLRERPQELGSLATVIVSRRFGLGRNDSDSVARNAAVGAASKGRDFLDATERLQTITGTANERRLDIYSGKSLESLLGQANTHSVITAARSELDHANSKEAALRRELTNLPRQGELERRIIGLLERMSPHEVRRLRAALSPPQVALTLKIKRAIRDAVLGRDEMHHG